jgi:hypothetical protein
VLVPLLTIGLPTSVTAAVILTTFPSYGLQPGPLLFSASGPLVWTLIASLYIGNVMLLLLNLPLAKGRARLLTIPAYGIYAGVLVFDTLGAFAAGGTAVDLLIRAGLGLLGLLMRQGGIPGARGGRVDPRSAGRGTAAAGADPLRGRPVDPVLRRNHDHAVGRRGAGPDRLVRPPPAPQAVLQSMMCPVPGNHFRPPVGSSGSC